MSAPLETVAVEAKILDGFLTYHRKNNGRLQDVIIHMQNLLDRLNGSATGGTNTEKDASEPCGVLPCISEALSINANDLSMAEELMRNLEEIA